MSNRLQVTGQRAVSAWFGKALRISGPHPKAATHGILPNDRFPPKAVIQPLSPNDRFEPKAVIRDIAGC